MKKTVLMCFAMVVAMAFGATLMAFSTAQAQVKQDMKAAGHSTADAGKDVGAGTKVAAKKTGRGTKKVAKKTASGTKKGYHKTVNGTKNLGDKIAGKPATH